MPSVDPASTFPAEIAGIVFRVKELKVSGVRDIAAVLDSVSNGASPLAVVDSLSSCAMRHVAGWDRPEEMTQSALEDALDLMQLMDLVKAALGGSRLTDQQKKKSE